MTPTIRLRNGSYFNFMEADVTNVTIEDIASALSKICRFSGQCDTHYSVAQHSVLCSGYGVAFQYEKLMHDVAESLLGDCSTPLKQLLPDYREIEQRVEKALFQKFNVDMDSAKFFVKTADIVLLKTEFLDVMHLEEWELPDCCYEHGRLSQKIVPWSHKKAKIAFLHKYKYLTGQYKENTIAKWWAEFRMFFMR